MEEKNNADLKEFITIVSQLDDTSQKRMLDFMIFLGSASEKQKADYEVLKAKAEAAYTEPSEILKFIEYAVNRIKKGNEPAEIWNEYQQEGAATMAENKLTDKIIRDCVTVGLLRAIGKMENVDIEAAAVIVTEEIDNYMTNHFSDDKFLWFINLVQGRMDDAGELQDKCYYCASKGYETGYYDGFVDLLKIVSKYVFARNEEGVTD